MKYDKAVEKIFSLRQLGMKLGLENVRNFLAYLGNPQLTLKTFHVAGSNGKGSTAAFLSSVLIEAGYKTALFTSPHFVSFTERIRINGKKIEREFVADFVERHIEAIDRKQITFFEITTAMAFEYFYRQGVDYAVIETGLGGRLDATNTMNPLAEIITTISLEHTRILGETLTEIAQEKAGIIKSNSKVFTGKMPEEAELAIQAVADSNNAGFFPLKNFAEINDDFVKLRFPEGDEFAIYKTGFPGAHQLRNAALAVLTLRGTLGKFSSETIIRGLERVRENSGLEGRFEIYSKKPLVIFDAAHNVEGIEVFLTEFEKRHSAECSRKILIYSALRDKNVKQILKTFKNKFDEVLLTEINFYRALSVEELFSEAKKVGLSDVRIIKNPAKYILEFLDGASSDCLVTLGSIYLLGEIKKEICLLTGKQT